MTELETLARAKMYMEKLANGINPVDESLIPDGEVVNNVRLSRCFFYVADVLRQVIENGGIGKPHRPAVKPFDLPAEQRAGFAFSDQPISVSEIVRRINALITDAETGALTNVMLTDWMKEIGILQNEISPDGRNRTRPTHQGEMLGITLETREGQYGPYVAVVYARSAQQFVLDNLDGVIRAVKEKKENEGKPWSAEEDDSLRKLFGTGAAAKEIAVQLKRSSGAVRGRLRKLGLKE